MQIAQEATPLERQRYLWRLRLRLARRNAMDFLSQLSRHPLALLSGVIILVYLLAAVFAPQITAHPRQPAPAAGPSCLGGRRQLELPPGNGFTGSRPADPHHLRRTRILAGGLSFGRHIGRDWATGRHPGWLFSRPVRRHHLALRGPAPGLPISDLRDRDDGIPGSRVYQPDPGPDLQGLVRGEMLSEKTQEYVEAARATGQSHLAIIAREILPNIIQSVFVLGTLRMGYMIIMEASLSFLGLGIPPRIPAWGSMVAEGRDYMLVAWWVSTFPGIAIVILVLAINLFGEGLRDILDPRLKIEG